MQVQANGITIDYGHEGSGPAVVLIHSLGLDRHMWWQQWVQLAVSYQTVAYDVRGHGRSSKAAGPYTLELFAADLKALLGALGIEKAHLVGISLGGMVSQVMALEYPELVASLLLVDTSSGYAPERRELFEQRATTAENQGMATLASTSVDGWFTNKAREENPALVERVKQIMLNTDPRGYAATCRAIADLKLTDRLGKISCPTMVVVGEQDQGTPPAMAEIIKQHIRGSELAVIPQAAHLSTVEQPLVFNDIMLRFLKRAAGR